MNVLSLFDGISCGRVALDRAGIKVDKYYSSEIDKYAIQISQKNYPNIEQLGDINNWERWGFPLKNIDLILAGFPCQAWSVAGKQKGINDPRGELIFPLLKIFNHIKRKNPNVKFLFENVRMKKEFIEYINNLFGLEPHFINSALVSAQNRKRLYWTNILNITQPEDKGIMLKDIVHENKNPKTELELLVPEATKAGYTTIKQGEGVDLTFLNSKTGRGRRMEDKSNCLTAANYDYNLLEYLKEYIVPFDKTLKILDKEVQRGKVGYFRKDSQANRVYFIHDKAVTLCGEAGGGAAKMGQYLFGCITPDRINKRQNGQRFNDGKKFYTLTAQDRHGILIEGYIRKLTPVECERLQTMPDNYTEGVSNTQRYKALGNGWTVDVIKHIFKNIKQCPKP